MLEPLTRKLEEKASRTRVAAAVTAKVAGVQMGSVLGWLSSKVLGQYEAFRPEGEPGRLVLVAPNIVETERRLGVDPHDFRLWVALHEVTHRTQFTAVPWMHDHVRSEIGALLAATSLDDPQQLSSGCRSVATGLPRGGSLIELLQTPEQRVVLDRVTAFMSLLEGHAEHVMDGVGPSVVPSVKHIRAKFDQRRKERGGLLDRRAARGARARPQGAAVRRGQALRRHRRARARAWPASTASGSRRRRCPPGRRSASRWRGCAHVRRRPP